MITSILLSILISCNLIIPAIALPFSIAYSREKSKDNGEKDICKQKQGSSSKGKDLKNHARPKGDKVGLKNRRNNSNGQTRNHEVHEECIVSDDLMRWIIINSEMYTVAINNTTSSVLTTTEQEDNSQQEDYEDISDCYRQDILYNPIDYIVF